MRAHYGGFEQADGDVGGGGSESDLFAPKLLHFDIIQNFFSRCIIRVDFDLRIVQDYTPHNLQNLPNTITGSHSAKNWKKTTKSPFPDSVDSTHWKRAFYPQRPPYVFTRSWPIHNMCSGTRVSGGPFPSHAGWAMRPDLWLTPSTHISPRTLPLVQTTLTISKTATGKNKRTPTDCLYRRGANQKRAPQPRWFANLFSLSFGV